VSPPAQVPPSSVDLYWLPLGAGGWFVRLNGRLYEAMAARRAGRRPRALFHAALEVTLDGDRYVIEMAPAWGVPGPDRGVVGEGAVGWRPLGRLRAFRYEVRRWRDGRIPDVAEAVDSPRRLSADAGKAARLLDLMPQFPTRTWGADQERTGDMWNSNSLVSWLLVLSGHDVTQLAPPRGGRAPGWHAGLVVAGRRRSRQAGPRSPDR
jgi:hypothetical protein